MNWIRNNKVVIEKKKMEPGATFSAFENHWTQLVEKMGTSAEDPEAALAVISHLSQMIALLRLGIRAGELEETPEQTCKGFWIQNKCSDQAIGWLLELKNKGLQLTQEDDERLVMMLHSLCELASRDGDILGYARSSRDVGKVPVLDGACSLASLLLEYSLGNEPTLGETARYSFILLIKLASRFPALEKSLSLENGYGYAHLVVSGLCACFAQLPTTCTPYATPDQIRPFVQQLKFVDDITHEAPLSVASAMAECFSNAFLDAIIRPALTQDEGRGFHKSPFLITSVYEGEAVVTRYLQTICELLTHPLLIKSLMKFIISMLPTTFFQRLNHPHTMVTVSTLSLFNVILDFYCEDFWYELILQHLLSQNHRMVLQRKTRINEIDFHDSSVRFLSLIPGCIIETLGQDVLVEHYMQYVNNESKRLASLDSLGLGFFTPTTALTREDTSTNNKNPIYPRWKLKYDGTDEVTTRESLKDVDCSGVEGGSNNSGNDNDKASTTPTVPIPGSVLSNGNKSESFSVESDSSALESEPLFLSNSKSNTSGVFENVSPQYDPLHSSSRVGDDEVPDTSLVFTNVSLQQPGLDDLSSIGLSEQSFDSLGSESSGRNINRNTPPSNSNFGNRSSRGANNTKLSSLANTNSSDGYSSFIQDNGSPSKSVLENLASFGPFLDSLFQALRTFTVLEPDVILMVTDLLSQLAGSRIPLVNSLLLDPTLILQPSYVSFASLLNRIRTELDLTLRNHPTLVLEVWNSMSKDGNERNRRSSTSSTNSNLSLSNSFDTDSSLNSSSSFSDVVRKKMSSGATIAAKFQSLFGKNFNPSLPAVNHVNDSPEVLQQVGGGQGYRYMTSPPNHQSPQNQSNLHDPLRIMATRAIFFSHWLLELAAISQQLCWKKT